MGLLHDSGRAVVERYGCARCHAIAGVDGRRRPGRPLAFASQVTGEYLLSHLRDPQLVRPGTPMPSIGGGPAEIDAAAKALVAYIKSLPTPQQVRRVPKDRVAVADFEARQVPTPMTWPKEPEVRPPQRPGRPRRMIGWPGMGFRPMGMYMGPGSRGGFSGMAPADEGGQADSDTPGADGGASPEELAAEGRRRFRQLGCAACHAPESPGEVDASLAPSLADVGAKWSQKYLRRFLMDPVGCHPQGEMPDFKLKMLDAEQLAAYLCTFTNSGEGTSSNDPSAGRKSDDRVADRTQPVAEALGSDEKLVARGKELAEQRGCIACHEQTDSPTTAPALGPDSDFSSGCLRSDRAAGTAPQFHLKVADRVATGEFLARRPESPSTVAPQETARRTIEHRYGCFRCHVRHGSGGDQLSRAILRFAGSGGITDQVPLTPPDISGAGARLQREWMLKVLAGDAPSPRPWLKVRMPGFGLSEERLSEVADLLAAGDEIPEVRAPRPHRLPTAMTAVAGRLLGGSGFSCINCHYVGKTPSSSETSAPDLTMIPRRVSRDWFHRWLSNPARIIPTTPMPAFDVPATKIAGEDLLVQKETLWQFLKHTPGQSITKMIAEGTTAVEVAGRRPNVVQGRVEGFAGLARGIALGFPNRRSLAFDYNRVAWRADWKGGYLNQAGRHGAQHWWEPAGAPAWLSHDNGPTVLYRQKATGKWIAPALWRERFGFVDRVTLVGRAVRLEYRLRAPGQPTGTHRPKSWVRVTELVEPNPVGPHRDGVTRTIRIAGVPDQYDLIVQQSTGGDDRKVLVLDPAEQFVSVDDDSHRTLVVQDGTGGRWAVRLAGHPSARPIDPPESITYPVEQPFVDDPPMDPNKRYDPIVQPGGGRMAVLVPNPGGDEPVELIWQTAQYAAGSQIADGPPARWPQPPEDPVLQDPQKLQYLSLPAERAELGQSFALSVQPGFKVERLPLEEEFLVCSLAFYKGKLLVGGYDGELRFADDTDEDGLPDSYRYFGGTLQQITNLDVYDDQVYVAAPGAVYRVADLNGDEVADSYELLSSLWDCSSHQNDWFFGLCRDRQGNLYGGNSTPFIYRPDGKPPGYHLRGDVLRITPDGRTEKVGTGLRFQFGWAQRRDGPMYFNINQGHYNYTNGIHLITEGAHYGFLEPDATKTQWPVVRAPYPWCKALNGMDFAESPVPESPTPESPAPESPAPFGPFQGQGFSADYNTNQVIRWTDHPIDDPNCPSYIPGRQGACYPFFKGTDAGPTEIEFGPDGALYVGFMCDQGWYGGRARGGIYKISYVGPRTFAVGEARAVKEGFLIELTAPADPASVTGNACRKVRRWWHENKGTYASPEIDHEDVPVHKVTLSQDGRTLTLVTDPHKTPRLYRVELKGLRSSEGRPLADGLVYLTVHWVAE